MEIKAENASDMIRSILKEEKLSQQDLAEKMGVTRQNVSQFLNRNRAGMRYDSFAKMVAALGYEVVVKKLEK